MQDAINGIINMLHGAPNRRADDELRSASHILREASQLKATTGGFYAADVGSGVYVPPPGVTRAHAKGVPEAPHRFFGKVVQFSTNSQHRH